MCRFLFVVFFLLLSSVCWSQEVLPLPSTPEFSAQVEKALAPVAATLSPEQRQELIPVFQLFEDKATTLQQDLVKLSESLDKERQTADRDRLILSSVAVAGLSAAIVEGLVLIFKK